MINRSLVGVAYETVPHVDPSKSIIGNEIIDSFSFLVYSVKVNIFRAIKRENNTGCRKQHQIKKKFIFSTNNISNGQSLKRVVVKRLVSEGICAA